MRKLIAILALAFTASACSPVQVAYWYGLHATPLPATLPVVATPTGWVDLGHGIWGPAILVEIRRCESGGNYTVKNKTSSARGAYQFLTSSWEWYGHAERYHAAVASDALPWQQDEAAVFTWQRSGTRPWAASQHCWG